jgi:arylsulfatase A-like enzyme
MDSATKCAESEKPNIIFIMADDLGYGDLSCYGQEHFSTPNIDRLALEGMRFTQFYSGSTVCAPARYSLMTGLHTGHATVRGNSSNVSKERRRVGLSVEDVTIAEVLKQEGYTTALVGKWGLGEADTQVTPTKKGFDFFYGFLNQRNAHNYYPPFLWRNETKVMLPDNDVLAKTGQYAHDLMTYEALGFVERSSGSPFFLYLAYTVPHAEMTAPSDSMDLFSGKFPEEPYVNNGGSYGSQKEPKAAFAAMVTRLDRDVGRLMMLLREKGIDGNTIVMFTSDNGPHGEGGHDYNYFDSNGPLRGMKRDLYDGGIRVPFIVRWPGSVAPGSNSDHIAAFWDFFPTAVDLSGAKTDVKIDGLSILPTFLGMPEEQKMHDYLYWEFFEQGGRQAVRMGDWKGVRYDVDLDPQSPLELYDLSTDLGEENNVAETNPEIVRRIEEIMLTARTESEFFKFRHEQESAEPES